MYLWSCVTIPSIQVQNTHNPQMNSHNSEQVCQALAITNLLCLTLLGFKLAHTPLRREGREQQSPEDSIEGSEKGSPCILLIGQKLPHLSVVDYLLSLAATLQKERVRLFSQLNASQMHILFS